MEINSVDLSGIMKDAKFKNTSDEQARIWQENLLSLKFGSLMMSNQEMIPLHYPEDGTHEH